ncbi:hypothetical protein M0Q28_01880 [Patescibacteria group bacterium]|nr:hypothetical protein [Patescibacteria group bacterium]
MNTPTTPPCEACPPCCKSCAWDPASAGPAQDSKRRLAVVRTESQYGCVRADTSIVVDQAEGKPFMQVGDQLLPLSPRFGGVIAGTKLERDIRASLA